MDTLNLEKLPPRVRRVLEAMLEGRTSRPEDLEELTDDERRELTALARTANLARLTLHRPEPTEELEAESLARAREALAQAGARAGQVPPDPDPAAPRVSLLDRLRRLLGVPTDDEP